MRAGIAVPLFIGIISMSAVGCTPIALEYFEKIEDQPRPLYGRIESVSARTDGTRLSLTFTHCEAHYECSKESLHESVVEAPLHVGGDKNIPLYRHEPARKGAENAGGTYLPIYWHEPNELLRQDGTVDDTAIVRRTSGVDKVPEISLHGISHGLWSYQDNFSSFYLARHKPGTGAVKHVHRLAIRELPERKRYSPIRYVALPVTVAADLTGGVVLAAVAIPLVFVPIVGGALLGG